MGQIELIGLLISLYERISVALLICSVDGKTSTLLLRKLPRLWKLTGLMGELLFLFRKTLDGLLQGKAGTSRSWNSL